MLWSIGMGQAVVGLSLNKVTWAPFGGFSLLAVREVPHRYSSFFFHKEISLGTRGKQGDEARSENAG